MAVDWRYGEAPSTYRDFIEALFNAADDSVESEETKKRWLPSLLSKVKHLIAGKTKKVEEDPTRSVFFVYKSLHGYLVSKSIHKDLEKYQWHLGIKTPLQEIETPKAQEQLEPRKWPSYAIEDFGKIMENTRGLESAGADKAQILYHIMETEALLGRVEKKARATNQECEARLTASLRDICRVHEPSEFSDEQIKRLTSSLRALVEGWGNLNREKVKWIRSRLLEVGLTWLPVTEKAEKDIAEIKKIAGIDEH